MEKIAKSCNKDKEKKLEKKALMEAFVDKEASDHVHTDSEGKKTGPSIHEDGDESKAHIHKLEDEGTTDKKENTEGHTHKELDSDGGETGPAEKTAFMEGFNKAASKAGLVKKLVKKAPKPKKPTKEVKEVIKKIESDKKLII